MRNFSKKEKGRVTSRKIFEKKFKALSKRVSQSNLVHWLALSDAQRHRIVHDWIDYTSYSNKREMPPKLKFNKFLQKSFMRFRVNRGTVRDVKIDILLEEN